ncbi:hypothetical protein Shyd_69120 [Streptomyces hydrogenans]|uniref:DNA ligase (ATP) n=1 Tax=Streptomyces hydrogenans TaxID=1873719 RepID=A0ABQ3PKJ2_9ACTN|nr:hypothetical protein Shyd_69120 [Streptomyces hydrogenans]
MPLSAGRRRPDAPAYSTKVRWIAPKLVVAVNEKTPGANMRALHALAPGLVKAGPATAAADPAPPPPAPAAPRFVGRLPPRARGAPSAGAAGARCSAAPVRAVERRSIGYHEERVQRPGRVTGPGPVSLGLDPC